MKKWFALLATFAIICAARFSAAQSDHNSTAGTSTDRLEVAGGDLTERITDYVVRVEVQKSGELRIVETITVIAANLKIRRGIYRDFPTEYEDGYGNDVTVGFEVEMVLRDGSSEPFHTDRLSNGTRIYIGDPDRYVSIGKHVYQIVYLTNRQLGYFDGHDELYWNAIGNGWEFSIERAKAEVVLPSSVDYSQVRAEVYTGAYGTRGKEASSQVGSSGVSFETTEQLSPGEGMTVIVSFPKGHVWEPSWWDRLEWFIEDNLGMVALLLMLFGSLGYLTLVWARIGKDPKPGVIYARYEPPAGYSPAAVRYIKRMSYDSLCFTVDILELAAKGYLSIHEAGGKYKLTKKESSKPLTKSTRVLQEAIFNGRSSLEVAGEYLGALVDAKGAHHEALKKEYRGIYFKLNAGALAPSALLVFPLFFAGVALGVGALLTFALLGAVIVLHILFIFWMRKPTPKGRLLLDQVDGFEMYLRVAEQKELNLKHPPKVTPELFEEYLPYAVALEVEVAWGRVFARAFPDIGRSSSYQPTYYTGYRGGLGDFGSHFGRTLSYEISAASTPPGSTSGGGGGGFSGGGGGGGGGGGW